MRFPHQIQISTIPLYIQIRRRPLIPVWRTTRRMAQPNQIHAIYPVCAARIQEKVSVLPTRAFRQRPLRVIRPILDREIDAGECALGTRGQLRHEPDIPNAVSSGLVPAGDTGSGDISTFRRGRS